MNHQSQALASTAVAAVKARLQHDYEQAYPTLGEIIHLVLDEEEANATRLPEPDLLLPELVASHIAKLNLRPLTGRNGGTAPQRLTSAASSTQAMETASSTLVRQLRAA